MIRPSPKRLGSLHVALAAWLLLAGAAHAQGYSIGWSSLQGGGGSSSGAQYQLGGTIGQFAPGTMAGSTFSLQGGMWSATPRATGAVPGGDRDTGPARIAFAGPNPVVGRTAFTFRLPTAGRAQLDLIDIAGKRVRSLAAGPHAAGRYVLQWNGEDASGRRLPAGVYFLLLDAAGTRSSCRVVVIN